MTSIAVSADAARGERDRELRNRAQMRGWLYVVLLVLFALFLVGGATRLTDFGLSITEWKPIHGIVPPCPMPTGRKNSPNTSRSPSIGRSIRA